MALTAWLDKHTVQPLDCTLTISLWAFPLIFYFSFPQWAHNHVSNLSVCGDLRAGSSATSQWWPSPHPCGADISRMLASLTGLLGCLCLAPRPSAPEWLAAKCLTSYGEIHGVRGSYKRWIFAIILQFQHETVLTSECWNLPKKKDLQGTAGGMEARRWSHSSQVSTEEDKQWVDRLSQAGPWKGCGYMAAWPGTNFKCTWALSSRACPKELSSFKKAVNENKNTTSINLLWIMETDHW